MKTNTFVWNEKARPFDEKKAEEKGKKVTIDFNVDIDPLSERIAKKAEESLVDYIKQSAETIIFKHSNYYTTYRQPNDPSSRSGVNEPIMEIIKQFMDENKDEIIDRVAKNLTKRMAMTKEAKLLKEKLDMED